jgi:PA14 domain.
MSGKIRTRIYARLGLILTVFVSLGACTGPTPVPTFTPFANPVATVTSTLPAPPVTDTAQVISATPDVATQPVGAQADTGWQGEYFSNDAWQEPATLSRVDPDSNLDFLDGSPAPDMPIDNFSIRWTRCLNLEERYYIFSANADDYVRVLVDDIQVLEAPLYARIERPFAVSAGPHCIKLEYKETIGYANVHVSFQPGESFKTVEASEAWQAEYFNNKDFAGLATYTRNDPLPQFDWKEGNPAPGIPIDGFSIRWTRCLELEGREYVFSASGDDYVRVLVDDVQVLEASASYAEAPFTASAGSHCIKVEYRENEGTANVSFNFR